MKFSDLGDNVAQAFVNLIPNGDKIYNQFFSADNLQGKYTIGASGRFDEVHGFTISGTDASGNKTSTYVSLEQAKAGNWNPNTNVLDTSQTFSIDDNGNVMSNPVTTTPPSNEGTGNTTPSTPGIDNSGNTNNGASSGGTSGVNDNNLFIDMNRIDQFQSSVNSSYNKMDRIYDSIIASLNKLGKADTSNGDITDNVKDAIQTCKNKKTYAESKRKKTINAIKSDKEAIERQQLADDLSSANTLEEVKKVMLAYLQGGEN